MKFFRFVAGCGGGGTTTPPTETPEGPSGPPPTETPTTPPEGEPDTAPAVEFYGEWGWEFQGPENYQTREGRFSIIDVAPDSDQESYGLFQFCYGQCYNYADGYAYMGIDRDGNLSVEFYRLSATNDLVLLYDATDTDGKLEADAQGRLTFEGRAIATEEYTDQVTGTIRVVMISDTPALAFAD